MNAFGRNNDGTLERTELTIVDGEIHLGGRYNPVTLKPIGTERLMGWGRDDGEATVYENEISGREIIVPERFAAKVAEAVTASA